MAHVSPLSETALQTESTRLSRSVKRPRVETPNTTSTCHKQLPPAADLLSQDHSCLGNITGLTYRNACLMSLTSHFKPVTCCSDHLRLQYIPDTSALARRHQERKRQFPHVEGNFATRVYVHGRHILLIHIKAASNACDVGCRNRGTFCDAAHCPPGATTTLSEAVQLLQKVLPGLQCVGTATSSAHEV